MKYRVTEAAERRVIREMYGDGVSVSVLSRYLGRSKSLIARHLDIQLGYLKDCPFRNERIVKHRHGRFACRTFLQGGPCSRMVCRGWGMWCCRCGSTLIDGVLHGQG